jgi:hypothetical protein
MKIHVGLNPIPVYAAPPGMESKEVTIHCGDTIVRVMDLQFMVYLSIENKGRNTMEDVVLRSNNNPNEPRALVDIFKVIHPKNDTKR